MDAFLKTHLKLASFSHRFFMKFHYFLGIDFRINFSSFFDGKWLPKWSGETYAQRPFWRPFRYLFRRSTFWCILVILWLTFGSLWVAFDSLWDTFGTLSVSFGCPLPQFCFPLAYFWFTFGGLRRTLGTFGSLLAILALESIIFGVF